MLGTEPGGQGGIATVAHGLKSSGFFAEHNVRYLVTHSSKSRHAVIALLLFARACLLLGYYLLFYRVGLVHLHMASRGSYTRKALLMRLGKAFGAKIVIHLHGGEFAGFFQSECSLKQQRHIRASFDLADRVIVLSSTWLDWVNTTLLTGQKKAQVIYNAVEEPGATGKKQTSENILCLGRLSHKKGTGDLIAAFGKIANRYPDSRLILGGDGDIKRYQHQAKALGVQDRVEFLGWVAGKDKHRQLVEACIYVLPSYHEGFPMGVLEAMSAEVAVIASRVGGIPDAIEHAREGILIDAGDIDALGDALELLLSDAGLRSRYTRAAKQKYQQNFTAKIMLGQLDHLYRELLTDL